jgi:hypothetical protein
MIFLGDLSDFEAFKENTIVDDSKGSPDKQSGTWSKIVLVLGDSSDLEVFEGKTTVKGRPTEKVTYGG